MRFLIPALAVLLPGAALGHSKAEISQPADGAVVAEVAEIALNFDAPMRIIALSLMQEGEDVLLERGTGMEPTLAFRAAPAAPLAPGAYRVEWRGMAADGHPMQGGFGFTVAE